MKIGLVFPIDPLVLRNPGCDFITWGIQFLCREAVDDEVEFVPIEMMRDVPEDWQAASECDVVILCGNPRFTFSPDSWWECGIWERLLELQSSGVRVIDGWGGSAHARNPEMSAEQMADALYAFPRTQEYLAKASQISYRITRDRVTQALYSRAGIPSVQLPCSSWWAPHGSGYRGLMKTPTELRTSNALVMLSLDGHPWGAEAVRAATLRMQNGLPCELIAVSATDARWAQAEGLHATLIDHPAELLRFFSRCRKVLSFRVHAAIPAASLGCEVGLVAVDSRALTVEAFGIPCTDMEQLERGAAFSLAREPDDNLAVEVMKGALNAAPTD